MTTCRLLTHRHDLSGTKTMTRSLPHDDPRRRRLALYCRRWGGQLLRVSKEKYAELKDEDGFGEALFTMESLGISWEEKIVIYSGDVAWTGIVHEMGHVFATAQKPGVSDEYDFFGWEYAMARILRGVNVWYECNESYGVGAGADLGELTRAARVDLMRERLAHAGQLRLVDSNNKPLAVR